MHVSIRRAICLLLCVIMLTGCQFTRPEQTTAATTEPTAAPTEETTAPTAEPTTEPTAAPTEEPTVPPTESVGLHISEPVQQVSDTYLEAITLSGSGDPMYSVSVNGAEVALDENGCFSCDVPLEVGENVITVSHKEEEVTYYVNRRYCVQFFTPNAPTTYGADASVFIKIAVRDGSTVKATFRGEEIKMKATVDQLASGIDEGFVLYSGYSIMPENNKTEKNFGPVEFTVTCDGITETYSSGDLTCAARGEWKKSDPDATPEGYRNVGSGYIAEVVDVSVETFNGQNVDDRSHPTYNYLPKGTVDYCYPGNYVSADGSKTYKLLRCGVRVYHRVKNTPYTTTSAAVDCYYGTLPDHNEINVASIMVDGHHTYLTLDCLWKAPFFFDFEEQAYTDASIRDYTVEQFDANYIDITFCYATQVGGDIRIPEDHPLFSSAEWIENTSDYTLRLYLKVQGGLYGWDAYYNAYGQLVFQFLNPVTVAKADNAYGADLTGVTILIDVGHGKEDTGAAGRDSNGKYWVESERNLALANELKEELESIGATVVINRTSQEEVLTQRERIRFMKEVAPDYSISIHHNSNSALRSQNGFETGYFTTYSQPAVQLMHEAAEASGIYKSSRTMWHKHYVTRQTICPNVLVECGFMSNTYDADHMSGEWMQKKAEAMTQGIVNYFLEVTEQNT